MIVKKKDPIEIQEKNLRGLDIKKLERGFGGIRFLHVKGSDSLSFKVYLKSAIILSII